MKRSLLVLSCFAFSLSAMDTAVGIINPDTGTQYTVEEIRATLRGSVSTTCDSKIMCLIHIISSCISQTEYLEMRLAPYNCFKEMAEKIQQERLTSDDIIRLEQMYLSYLILNLLEEWGRPTDTTTLNAGAAAYNTLHVSTHLTTLTKHPTYGQLFNKIWDKFQQDEQLSR